MLEIPQIIKDFAEEALEQTKYLPQPICSVYIGGSRTLPWIKNPNDWDILVLIRDVEHRAETLKAIIELRKKYKQQFEAINANVLLRCAKYWALDAQAASDQVAIHFYTLPYLIKVAGEDVVPKTDQTVLTVKDKIIPSLLFEWNHEIDLFNEKGKCSRLNKFYKPLTVYYMLASNSLELTQEQQIIISEVHDDVSSHWDLFEAFGSMLENLN